MWKLYYTQIVSSLHDSFNERFFLLVAWGDYGAFAHNWKDSFSELGILHLLVLSGSQMTLLVHSQTKLFLFITRNQLLKNFRVFLPIFLFFSSFYSIILKSYTFRRMAKFIFCPLFLVFKFILNFFISVCKLIQKKAIIQLPPKSVKKIGNCLIQKNSWVEFG